MVKYAVLFYVAVAIFGVVIPSFIPRMFLQGKPNAERIGETVGGYTIGDCYTYDTNDPFDRENAIIKILDIKEDYYQYSNYLNIIYGYGTPGSAGIWHLSFLEYYKIPCP
jgi:hypothetical protein